MLVRMTPITNGSCKPSPDVDACATPTTTMLKALTKHFAKLSRYFNTNETRSPQVANATSVPIAAPLNLSYVPYFVISLRQNVHESDINPKEEKLAVLDYC